MIRGGRSKSLIYIPVVTYTSKRETIAFERNKLAHSIQ